MPKKPKAKAQAEEPKSYDEFVDDADSLDDEAPDVDPEDVPVSGRSRDWRDVERYREQRELRRLVDDEFDDLLD